MDNPKQENSIEADREHGTRYASLFRAAGALIVITCLVGIIAGVSGVVITWQYKDDITLQALNSLEAVETALDATKSGLENLETALSGTISSLDTLQGTLETTAATVQSSTPSLSSLVKITRDDLPATVESAKTSLASAQESARVIDQVMRALTVLPFIDYDPETPLHEALEEMAGSLDNMPAAFFTMQAGLTTTQHNLETVQADVADIAVDVGEIKSSLEESQSSLDAYQQMTTDMISSMYEYRERIPGWLTAAAWLVSGLLVWAILLQVGLVFVGVFLIRLKKGNY